MAEWPAKSEPHHDARDDDVIPLTFDDIEPFAEKLRREHLVEPAPMTDPALADREEEQ